MTVIRPNSVSGINSITAKTNEAVSFYESDGSSGNVIAGVITATTFKGAVTGAVTGDITGNVTGNLSGDIVGTRTLGTGVTVTAAGIVSATQYYGSATNMTAIPGANITGTIPAAALTNVDLESIRKDIATLALQVAVDSNKAAYNLQDSFIDQFEDDTGLVTQTTVDRDTAGEFVSAVTSTNVTFSFGGSGTDDKPTMYGANPNTGQRTRSGGWNYESVEGGGSDITTVNYADFTFDLANDFFSRMYIVQANGNTHVQDDWISGGILIIRNTSATLGKNPKYNNTTIFRGNQVSGANVSPYTMSTGTNMDDYVLTSAYASHINLTSFTETKTTGGDRDETVDMASHNSNGSYFVQRWTSNNSDQCAGTRVQYDESESKLELDFFNTNGARHTNSPTLTINNVPKNGRVIHFQGQNGVLNDWHTIWSSSLTNTSGTLTKVTSSATGTLIGKGPNQASSARTKISGVLLYKDSSGTAAIGTDLKIYVSCNAGTNWHEVTSRTAGPDFSAGIKTIYLNETTCTSGTDIRYKVEWANQAAGSKVTQLHGVALNY